MTTQIDWEATFHDWSKPANERQEARAIYTAEEIRTALSDYAPVNNSMMKVAAQGSKRNNTDTVDESDVDIRVELHLDQSQPETIPPVFIYDRSRIAKSVSDADLGLDVSYRAPVTQATFKDHITNALNDQFKDLNVDRHDKCIKVSEERLPFPADVVPCYPYRMFYEPGRFEPGIAIPCDSGAQIINYPEQHYSNGVGKDKRTGGKFKEMVRCIKRMENELLRSRILTHPLPSFFLECLIYNCPDDMFAQFSNCQVFKDLIFYLYSMLEDAARSANMVEVNGVKSLFHDGQSWTAKQGSVLAAQAWFKVVHA